MKLKGQVKFVSKDKNQFFSILRKRVDAYFKENNISKHADSRMVIKTIVLLSTYSLPFIAMLLLDLPFWADLIMWSIMGFSLAGIGMSVMHDANHGAYSANKHVNFWMGHTLNILGGSVVNWKLQHNVLHHTYTNVTHMDDDIDDKLIMKFSPHTPVKWYHKLQFVYAFFFYGILSLYWAVMKDFVQFVKYNREGVNTFSKKENAIFLLRIIIDKTAYFFGMFGVPILFFNFTFNEVLMGFLLMHFIGGVVLTVIFQLAHTIDETSHPMPDENGNIENDWAIHQLNTTANFSRDNKWLSWYVGGLNFQVEHHLFPRICHVHYPAIAPIVKQTAEEFGIPYLENETFMEALRSHVSLLQRIGKLPSLNEALA